MRALSRPTRNTLLALVAIFAAAAMMWTPPFVTLGLAIAAAVGWCIWLERHPTA